MNWQPIATAPKDSLVLLSDGQRITVGHWCPTDDLGWLGENSKLDNAPYWAPLPPLPSESPRQP